VVCGIWLKGKHSDFTGSSSESVGRKSSWKVMAIVQVATLI